MSGVNKHGLSRYIQAAVKFRVRTRCGFACVLCGRACILYHHFDPPFEQAAAHDANGITLLCNTCLKKHQKGQINNAAIAAADAAPCARQPNSPKNDPLFATPRPCIRLAGTDFVCRYPVIFGRKAILGFDPPEAPGAPLRLQALLSDNDGQPLLEIVDNEWRAGSRFFDVETLPNRLILKDFHGQIFLQMSLSPARGLSVDALNMTFSRCTVTLNADSATATSPTASLSKKLPPLQSEAGLLIRLDGAIHFPAPTAPFFQRQIDAFRPLNPLEWSLCDAKDSPLALTAFLTSLLDSPICIPIYGKLPGNRGEVVTANDPLRLIVLTAPSRMDTLRKRAGIGDDNSLRYSTFRDFLPHIPRGTSLWINPLCSLSLTIPGADLDQYRNSR